MVTEYKDRIVPSVIDTIETSFKGSSTLGPSNSYTLIPTAMTNKWQQGNSNGNIDGNQINARYLNMKVELDFQHLPSYVTSAGVVNQPIEYYIVLRQCLIMEDISEAFNLRYTNPVSGRQERALEDDGTTQGTQRWDEIARQRLYNNGLDSDFLTYEKRQDSQVRILKTHRVKYNLNNRISDGLQAALQVATPNAARQRFSFDWKMPKENKYYIH